MHICSIVPVPPFIFCCFKMTWSFARAVWQRELNDVPLINFTVGLSLRQGKYVFSLTSLVSDDSDKGQAEISSGETNTVCVNNHHSHKQEMCQRWSYSGRSAVCLSVAFRHILYCLKHYKLKLFRSNETYSEKITCRLIDERGVNVDLKHFTVWSLWLSRNSCCSAPVKTHIIIRHYSYIILCLFHSTRPCGMLLRNCFYPEISGFVRACVCFCIENNNSAVLNHHVSWNNVIVSLFICKGISFIA